MPNNTDSGAAWERRTLPFTVEIRAAADGAGPKIVGHGAVFDSLSLDLGGFKEKIDPRAGKRAVRNAPLIKSYFNHNPDHVLGRTDNKTLVVGVDERGITFEVEPPDTTWARDLMTSIERGDIRDASFSFRTIKDRWETDEDGTQIRTLLDFELRELGPVADGAYPEADSQVRALLESRGIGLGVPTEDEGLSARALLGDGVDLEALAAGDEAQVRAAIAALEARLPAPEPEATEPPDEGWRVGLALRRRRLELAAARD